MTENEAINQIEGQLTFNELNREAKSMAIKALEECLRYKDLLDFLSDKMNPNDFEVYMRIYNSQDEKESDEKPE